MKPKIVKRWAMYDPEGNLDSNVLNDGPSPCDRPVRIVPERLFGDMKKFIHWTAEREIVGAVDLERKLMRATGVAIHPERVTT